MADRTKFDMNRTALHNKLVCLQFTRKNWPVSNIECIFDIVKQTSKHITNKTWHILTQTASHVIRESVLRKVDKKNQKHDQTDAKARIAKINGQLIRVRRVLFSSGLPNQCRPDKNEQSTASFQKLLGKLFSRCSGQMRHKNIGFSKPNRLRRPHKRPCSSLASTHTNGFDERSQEV